nr:hypothetical protein [Tanacetum cinerariifolium]
ARLVFRKHLPRINGTRGSGSNSMTTKSAGKWKTPTLNETSLAIPIGVVDGVRAGDWFFLSKSNALTMSLSSATSDEMAGVEKLIPTLATTALARV